MSLELALVWLSLTGVALAALAENWSERQRMTTIFIMLLVLILALLAMR